MRISLRFLPLLPLAACSSLPHTSQVQSSTAGLAPAYLVRAEQASTLWDAPGYRERFLESFISEVEVEPTVTTTEIPRLEEAMELFYEERYARCLDLLRKNNSETASAVFDFYIGNVHVQLEQLPEARDAYLAAVEKYPKFLRAWRGLGIAQASTEDFAGAATSFGRVLQLGGNDTDTYRTLGMAYSQLGNHLGAETAFRMASLMEPGNMELQYRLAQAVQAQGRYPEAAAILDYLLGLDPSNADLWMAQARAYLQMGEDMKAAENLEMVDRLGASSAQGLEILGSAYINQKLYDTGVDFYVRALSEFSEGDPLRAIKVAGHLALLGRSDDTRTLLTAIRDHRGEVLDADQRKVLLQLDLRLASIEGSGEAEIEALNRIVEMDPLDGDAMLQLGDKHQLRGDVEQAILLYERAAMIESFEVLAKRRHGTLLARQKRYAEAIPLLKAAQTIEPLDSVAKVLEEIERAAK